MSIKAAYKYRIKPFIIRALHTPKWFIQRGKRGWSDRDAWNADMYLAGMIADIMQHLIDKGVGVPMIYSAPDDDINKMSERMKQDYDKHIKIFSEYSENGLAVNEDWKKEFGGVSEKEILNSLDWFKEHFMDLWD
jgi:hypothetical protein